MNTLFGRWKELIRLGSQQHIQMVTLTLFQSHHPKKTVTINLSRGPNSHRYMVRRGKKLI